MPSSTNPATSIAPLLCSNNWMTIIKSENYCRSGISLSNHLIHHLILHRRKPRPRKLNQMAHRGPQSQTNLRAFPHLPRILVSNCHSGSILKDPSIKQAGIHKRKYPTQTDGPMVNFMLCALSLRLKKINGYHQTQRLTQLVGRIRDFCFGSDIGPVKCDIAPVIFKRNRLKFCGLHFQNTPIRKITPDYTHVGRKKDINQD